MFFKSATSNSASRCRSTRSVRHSLANSTTERGRFPLNCSSLVSNRENKANASAVDPAKPARILSLYRRRSFRALLFNTSWPSVTCPSAAITTLSSRRTQSTVVDRILIVIVLCNLILAYGGLHGRLYYSGSVSPRAATNSCTTIHPVSSHVGADFLY